jgi:hypothetical protein
MAMLNNQTVTYLRFVASSPATFAMPDCLGDEKKTPRNSNRFDRRFDVTIKHTFPTGIFQRFGLPKITLW